MVRIKPHQENITHSQPFPKFVSRRQFLNDYLTLTNTFHPEYTGCSFATLMHAEWYTWQRQRCTRTRLDVASKNADKSLDGLVTEDGDSLQSRALINYKTQSHSHQTFNVTRCALLHTEEKPHQENITHSQPFPKFGRGPTQVGAPFTSQGHRTETYYTRELSIQQCPKISTCGCEMTPKAQ